MVELGHTDSDDHMHYHGVDMAEKHLSVSDALRCLLIGIRPLKSERVRLQEADGRILFDDIKSPINLPRLARSTRDGYAINISKDGEPGQKFKIVGDIRIGIVPKLSLRKDQAVRIATGSYIPRGANSVVMLEYASEKDNIVTVDREIKIRENIIGAGEDIVKGRVLFNRKTRILPQHIALLSMLGITSVKVFSRPRVAYFSTGDELIDAEQHEKRDGHLIYDANRPFINAMIKTLGAEPIDLGIAKDKFQTIKAKMLKGLKYDALILSAGSSVGERDYVSKAIATMRGVKMLVHGIAMRPSSPTGLATYEGKPIILLPGFPTSAIMSFLVFAKPAILALSGSSSVEPLMIKARLVDDYEGKKGIRHFVRVNVKREGDVYTASIVRPTEAYSSRWLLNANGVAVIGEDRSFVKANEEVDIFMIGEL